MVLIQLQRQALDGVKVGEDDDLYDGHTRARASDQLREYEARALYLSPVLVPQEGRLQAEGGGTAGRQPVQHHPHAMSLAPPTIKPQVLQRMLHAIQLLSQPKKNLVCPLPRITVGKLTLHAAATQQ